MITRMHHGALPVGPDSTPWLLTLLEGAGGLGRSYERLAGNVRAMSHMALLLSLRGCDPRGCFGE